MEKHFRILLAEDDRNLGNILKSYLEAKGYDTTLCVNGKEAWDIFQKEDFDFCIIDIMMPVKDGFTLASEIRSTSKDIPLLFLTAKSMQDDKLKAFQIGADDYITKPFSMEELIARMKAILRRAEKFDPDQTRFEIGMYQFDYIRQKLTFHGGEQKLTSKEAELLRMLCQRKNDVLDRTEALKKIWQDDSYFNARSMDVYVTKLRKYLSDDSRVQLLNVHGIGFRLVMP